MFSFNDIIALVPNTRPVMHIAALVCGQRIIDVTTNDYATHAEEAIVGRIRRYHLTKRKLKLFVVRCSSNNRFSRPCRDCTALLLRVPHVRVFYSDANGDWCEELSFDSMHISRRRAECRQKNVCTVIRWVVLRLPHPARNGQEYGPQYLPYRCIGFSCLSYSISSW